MNLKISFIENSTTVPLFSWDFRLIEPPKLSTIFFEIDSPSPVPLELMLLRCWFTIPNSLNSFGTSLSWIPMPVSLTLNFSCLRRSNDAASKAVSASTCSTMPPCIVNLNAFEIRLISTCLMRPTSEQNDDVSSSSLASMSKVMPFCFHWNSKMYWTSLMRLPTRNGCSLSENVPASIFAKSRMSSTNHIKLDDEILHILKNFSFDSFNCSGSTSFANLTFAQSFNFSTIKL